MTKSERKPKPELPISMLIARILRTSAFGIPSAFGDSDFGFKTGSGVGVAPTEAELMRLA